MSVRVFVEGGGSTDQTRRLCREAFRLFLEKVVGPGRRLSVVPCGSRQLALRQFERALGRGDDAFVILLVDAEGPVQPGILPWQHLASNPNDRWVRPPDATDDQAQLMVECMEAWLLADRSELQRYYGQGFQGSALPNQQNVEAVGKLDIERSLQRATRNTSKGRYHKTKHAFELLRRIPPSHVGAASQHARRLFEVIQRHA